MELFFVFSPIGLLQALLKENKLYSLSQIKQNTINMINKKSNLNDLPLFLNVSNSRSQNQLSPPIYYYTKDYIKLKKKTQKLKSASRPEKLKFESSLKNFSYLVDEKNFSILKRQKKSSLAKDIIQKLNLYFEKKLKKFEIPIYNRGTDFQKKVWQKLQKIPWGQTKQYSQIAKELKKPKAYRAVGNCCGKNPFLIIVPCHRVLSSSGLGGFALGLKTKKYLLSLEQSP